MRRVLVTVAAVAVFSSCSGGGGTPDSGTPLDCPGVLQCIADCPTSTTTTCEDACVARGTAAAVSQVNALASCAEAHSCGDSGACLQMNCGPELAACNGGGGGDGGADGFPARYTGTVTDEIKNFSGSVTLLSTGTATFVRDDAADPNPGQGWAFYRLETITYTATASGQDAAGCTWSANETVTFNNPGGGNMVSIQKTPAGGPWTYNLVTTLTESRPNALTITCPPPVPPRVTDFSAGHNAAASIPLPTTTSLTHLQASVPAYMQPGRTWSWDLTAN